MAAIKYIFFTLGTRQYKIEYRLIRYRDAIDAVEFEAQAALLSICISIFQNGDQSLPVTFIFTSTSH